MAVPRQRLHAILESAAPDDGLSRAADLAIVTLIIVNVVAIILESVPAIGQAYLSEFRALEIFSVAIFTAEYLLRLWACSAGAGNGSKALRARIRYVFSLSGIIDLAAIAPFYLGMLTTLDLRFLRALRLVRILKLTRYSPAMTLLLRALRRERQALSAAIFLLAIALVVAACGIYLCERGAQPDSFGSIPAAIWWAVATLTTVGYGDVTPITIGGKIFGAGVMIVGVGMVALPSGILASTFAEELRRRREDFIDIVDCALDDGVLSADELAALDTLRTRSGLSSEEAARILEFVRSKNAMQRGRCPHCGAVRAADA